jgi:hypothetical protein
MGWRLLRVLAHTRTHARTHARTHLARGWGQWRWRWPLGPARLPTSSPASPVKCKCTPSSRRARMHTLHHALAALSLVFSLASNLFHSSAPRVSLPNCLRPCELPAPLRILHGRVKARDSTPTTALPRIPCWASHPTPTTHPIMAGWARPILKRDGSDDGSRQLSVNPRRNSRPARPERYGCRVVAWLYRGGFGCLP